MLSLGEINYFGTRGVPRNQVIWNSLIVFMHILATSITILQSCSWGRKSKWSMWSSWNVFERRRYHILPPLGDFFYKINIGTEKNISKAVTMYNQAAKDGSIRALNGLGYIYFFGHGDEAPMNKVTLFWNKYQLEMIKLM